MAGEGGELVGRADEQLFGQLAQLAGHGLGEALRRIQSGAHGGAALGQLADRRQGGVQRPVGVVELGDEGRQLLAEGDRRGVHQVGAAGLDKRGMARGLCLQAAL
ncbi:hypothetical protein D3C81_1875240 [compost metagenome]